MGAIQEAIPTINHINETLEVFIGVSKGINFQLRAVPFVKGMDIILRVSIIGRLFLRTNKTF